MLPENTVEGIAGRPRADKVAEQMAEFLRWRVGNVTVTRVVELTSASLGSHLLPQATPDLARALPWLKPFVDERGELVLSFHSLVLECRGEVIVVDTCIGNDKERTYPRWNAMQSNFLADFNAAGFNPLQVATVLCTHMHVDHVGWNTRWVDGRWQPTFGNARHLYAEAEWEHWQTHDQSAAFGPVIEDSVQPIFDADLADLVPGDHAVSDEVSLTPTPGHTPGHVAVYVKSRGEEAVITGDLMHHPCQIAHPDWGASVDFDPALAAATRTEFLNQYADRPVLVIGTHFAGPTAGRIVRDGDAFRLDC